MSGFLFARLQFQQFVWPRHRLSVALPLGINGAARHSKTGRLGLNNRQPLPYLCSCGSKNRAGRSLPQRRPATNVALGPAGFDPLKHFPHSPPTSFKFGLSPISVGFGLRAPGWAEGPARRPGDPKGSQVFSLTHHQPTTQISWVRPVAHPPRRSSPGRTGRRFCESRYSLSAQIPAQSAPQSSLQFSAPCQPHCGSAFAPPRFSRALRGSAIFGYRRNS